MANVKRTINAQVTCPDYTKLLPNSGNCRWDDIVRQMPNTPFIVVRGPSHHNTNIQHAQKAITIERSDNMEHHDTSSHSSRDHDGSSFSTSDHGGSSSTSGMSHTSRLSREEQVELAAKETRMIRKSRSLFVVLLLVLTGVAGGLTFFFTRQDETNAFEDQFEAYAFEIRDSAKNNARNVYNAVSGFGTTVTSYSSYTGVSWPNMTLPHFPKRGQSILETSGADLIMLSPVVTTALNSGWEEYSANKLQWISCSLGLSNDTVEELVATEIKSNKPREEIVAVHSWISESTGIPFDQIEDIYQVPAWQMWPLEENDLGVINFDLLSHPSFHRLFHWIMISHEAVLSEVIDLGTLLGTNQSSRASDRPQSLMIQPVFRAFDDCYDNGEDANDVGALIVAVLPWDIYLENLLPDNAKGVYVVLENSCGDVFTYRIEGSKARFLGLGDHHETEYDDLAREIDFEPFGWHDEDDKENSVNCHYVFWVYPSNALEDDSRSSKPALLTFTVILIFVLTTGAFAAYDCLVQRRQEKVMDSAMKTNAIVSSLFPAEVRDRLFHNGKNKKEEKKELEKAKKKMGGLLPALAEAPKFRLSSFLTEDERKAPVEKRPDHDGGVVLHDKPIADLFPHTTVMFADIAGFTAWSSVRDPTQVFTLLETVYHAFDRIAKRRGVFKVETIGDSYVAVAGLPEPRKDHAAAMSRFSRDCLIKMNVLTTRLEETLGPDTGDLTMRFGLHSGPVTAGVLRGEKSRFQLFGDTVNTAARMESTGQRNRVQMSEETAKELIEAGKEHWVVPREEMVEAKGKGRMQTYWLQMKDDARTSSQLGENLNGVDEELADKDGSEGSEDNQAGQPRPRVRQEFEAIKLNAKTERMVGWTVDILSKLLKQIVAVRNAMPPAPDTEVQLSKVENALGLGDKTVQEEVTEFVPLPQFEHNFAESIEDYHQTKLKPEVLEQLRKYVREVAALYRENPFHNFEHASHVTMSISKLLGRIVAADVAPGEKEHGQGHILGKLHDRTYGMSSDPLSQFAAVFSGFIHDVDHRGLPNFLLIREDPELAAMYKNRSVAEQNSVDIAWERLMEPEFTDLRRCIYTTTSELHRFRQMVVNTVMATDIFDKDFAELRRSRWEKCFREGPLTDIDLHRRATIVLEHLIQASDVAHTMQHWQIYQKWNQRLFEEMYKAYKMGRLDKDPSESWYKSEIGFFDNYIIPLAKKLKECGVFGVSSDEYLNYAVENRREWSVRGEQMVADALERVRDRNWEEAKQ